MNIQEEEPIILYKPSSRRAARKRKKPLYRSCYSRNGQFQGETAFYCSEHSVVPIQCERDLGLHDKGNSYNDKPRDKRVDLEAPKRAGMGRKKERGLDYTPLYRFLLSKVGESWDMVYREARSRLKHAGPIFWIVARGEDRRSDVVRVGVHSYYSRLYIDENNTLQIINPSLGPHHFYPACSCCVHTFNGLPFTNAWVRLRH